MTSEGGSGSDDQTASLVGQKLGDYDVIRPLGQGGMGFVYEGLQSMIGKRVAIKLLRNEIAFDPDQMKRLLAEARTVNAVRHRGIVDIFGFGKLPDGRQYLVMELLEGLPLDELLARSSPLAFEEALPILDEILDALGAAHQVGVIHRDLKPSNIFISVPQAGSAYVKLLDFGLAKQAQMPHGTTPQTRASMMIGTPTYMAPEQARGDAVGPATDLYALGAIIFEMLTSKAPFIAPTPFEVVYKHLKEPPPRLGSALAGANPAVEQIVDRLLAKDPAARPASVEALRAELRLLAGAEGRLPPMKVPAARNLPVGVDTAQAAVAQTHISGLSPEHAAAEASAAAAQAASAAPAAPAPGGAPPAPAWASAPLAALTAQAKQWLVAAPTGSSELKRFRPWHGRWWQWRWWRWWGRFRWWRLWRRWRR